MQVSSCLVTAPATCCCRCRLPSSQSPAASKVGGSNYTSTSSTAAVVSTTSYGRQTLSRREMGVSSSVVLTTIASLLLLPEPPAVFAAEDEDYVKETSDVIKKVRATIVMDKTDPNVASAVAELRDASNSWVAKYRREKSLLGRTSFRDMYSALNAVSGHYISFGPTAPIPAKRKARILEEVDTAEKALLRGR